MTALCSACPDTAFAISSTSHSSWKVGSIMSKWQIVMAQNSSDHSSTTQIEADWVNHDHESETFIFTNSPADGGKSEHVAWVNRRELVLIKKIS